jgi:hypothetical protein
MIRYQEQESSVELLKHTRSAQAAEVGGLSITPGKIQNLRREVLLASCPLWKDPIMLVARSIESIEPKSRGPHTTERWRHAFAFSCNYSFLHFFKGRLRLKNQLRHCHTSEQPLTTLFRKAIHFLILGYRVLTQRKYSISRRIPHMTIKQETSTPSTTEIIAGVDKQRQRNPNGRGPGRRFEKGNVYGWKPGQSGNSTGRPKCITLSEAYRKALAQIDESDPEKRTFAEVIAARQVRVAAGLTSELSINAAREIADRTEGKARQAVKLDTKGEALQLLAAFLGVSVDQLPSPD